MKKRTSLKRGEIHFKLMIHRWGKKEKDMVSMITICEKTFLEGGDVRRFLIEAGEREESR